MRLLRAEASELGGSVTIGFSKDDLQLLITSWNPETERVDLDAQNALKFTIINRIVFALRAIQ